VTARRPAAKQPVKPSAPKPAPAKPATSAKPKTKAPAPAQPAPRIQPEAPKVDAPVKKTAPVLVPPTPSPAASERETETELLPSLSRLEKARLAAFKRRALARTSQGKQATNVPASLRRSALAIPAVLKPRPLPRKPVAESTAKPRALATPSKPAAAVQPAIPFSLADPSAKPGSIETSTQITPVKKSKPSKSAIVTPPAPVPAQTKPQPAPQPAVPTAAESPVKAAAPRKRAAKQIAAATTATAPAQAASPAPAAVAPAVPTAPAKTKAPRKRAAKAKAPPALPIPAILLEGDEVPAPALSGPGQRYALPPGSEGFGGTSEEIGELPDSYGTQRLLLAARDPNWLYAHWDLTRDQQRDYNKLSADGHLVLRVYVDQIGGDLETEVHVHPESRHWFIHVARAGARYVAELGYRAFGGQWINISTSSATLTPPDSLSGDTSVQFATLPTVLPLPKLAAMVRELAMESIPLVQAIEELREAGHVQLPSPAAFDTHAWTPEQEQALMQVVNMDSVRRVWVGSLEITELIRRKLVGELASQAAAGMAAAVELGAGASPVGGFGSVTSPFGGGGEGRAKSFWFNVNAELIIYGATEPDATVTISGRKIKLRPDGSFSYRFALPDGNYLLPAFATSADGTDTRWASLNFSRATHFGGEVGAHPQDPSLKPPKAESL
jgi:uncharacterized protein